jgi:hypothetical protein
MSKPPRPQPELRRRSPATIAALTLAMALSPAAPRRADRMSPRPTDRGVSPNGA